jgi:hypothetical protein
MLKKYAAGSAGPMHSLSYQCDVWMKNVKVVLA